jgi:hypothetical protein
MSTYYQLQERRERLEADIEEIIRFGGREIITFRAYQWQLEVAYLRLCKELEDMKTRLKSNGTTKNLPTCK